MSFLEGWGGILFCFHLWMKICIFSVCYKEEVLQRVKYCKRDGFGAKAVSFKL